MKAIKQKAKAYDEAIKKAKERYATCYSPALLEYIFPELKESEGERIRKELLEHCKNQAKPYIQTGNKCPQIQSWIAWLEKDEQKPANKAKVKHLIPQKGMYYTCIKDYYSSDNTHLCVKGNIYKSFFNGYIDDESHLGLSWTNSCAEKYFEPTKDEDWIVCEHDNVIGKPMQYKEFKKKVNQKFIENLKAQGLTPKLRLWNLKDAKDGDVLVGNYGTFIFMSENNGYCGVLSNNTFIRGTGNNEWTGCLHPATKGQRDLLFQKMKEAGYTFDLEKKVLKKVGNEIEIPFGANDSELQEATYFIPKGFYAKIDNDKVVIKKDEKPAAWSKKDEKMFEYALNMIEWYSGKNEDKSRFVSDWLKSIKQRIGG